MAHTPTAKTLKFPHMKDKEGHAMHALHTHTPGWTGTHDTRLPTSDGKFLTRVEKRRSHSPNSEQPVHQDDGLQERKEAQR